MSAIATVTSTPVDAAIPTISVSGAVAIRSQLFPSVQAALDFAAAPAPGVTAG